MMLQVITYTIAVAAALSVAALCAERFARLHGLPLRAAWAAAMMLSVLLPAAMILLARPVEFRDVPIPAADQGIPYINPESTDFVEATAAQLPARPAQSAPTSIAPEPAWQLPRPSDSFLIAAWMAASSMLALYLLGANLLLRRRMMGWRNAVVHDHKVLISEATGPALLGAFTPRIVVPRWLLLQPHSTQALVLEHEQQHVLARDALLIMAGLVAIVAAPWNLPLWWQWRRMRQAIEMDCDARVLDAGVEANTYAQVLLAVTQRSRKIPAGALAMSEPVHALERRIANLLPDAIRYARLQSVAVLLLAAAGAGAALALEAPALPGRAAAAQSAIMAAAAAAPRAVEPASAVKTQALAHLAKERASFTVRILSPVVPPGGGADAASAGLEKYYAILVEKLTAVPGLKLITPETPDLTVVHFEISMQPGAGGKGVQVDATSVQGSSATKVRWTSTESFLFANPLLAALSEAVPVDEPVREMERFVERMRLELFPLDRALLDQKMAELRDPQLRPVLRAQALSKLMTVDSRYDSFGSRLDSFSGRVSTYRPDAALLATATELATTATDPDLRLSLWNTLITDPLNPFDPGLLVAQAGRALARETDQRVQLMLVNILNLNAADPQASAALESFASSNAGGDRSELARMAARRLLNGGAGWKDYFMTRLKDPQVSDAERLKLLHYVSYISSSGRWVRSGARMKLDEAAERSLGSLLNSSASTEVVTAAAGLLRGRLLPVSPGTRGSAAAREELIGFMRAGTGKPEADPKIRRSLLGSLFHDLRSDPQIRLLFEEIVARDRDPVLREVARQALEQAPQQ
jgi:hypothetical protein